MPIGRTQREEKKVGLFVELSCLLPKLWSLKGQKMLIFVFSTNNSKTFVKIWAICLSTHGRSYPVLAENGMVNRLWTQLFVR